MALAAAVLSEIASHDTEVEIEIERARSADFLIEIEAVSHTDHHGPLDRDRGTRSADFLIEIEPPSSPSSCAPLVNDHVTATRPAHASLEPVTREPCSRPAWTARCSLDRRTVSKPEGGDLVCEHVRRAGRAPSIRITAPCAGNMS